MSKCRFSGNCKQSGTAQAIHTFFPKPTALSLRHPHVAAFHIKNPDSSSPSSFLHSLNTHQHQHLALHSPLIWLPSLSRFIATTLPLTHID